MLAMEKRWANVVLSSFAGSDAGFVPSNDVDYISAAERFTGAASDKASLGLRFAFLLFFTAPIWARFRPRTLAGYAPDERARLMDQLLCHPIFAVRELCLLLKLVACMAIFRPASSRARSGYDRPGALRVLDDEVAA